MSLPHALMIPKSSLKPSCAIEGAAIPAANISAVANPEPIRCALAALVQVDCMLLPPLDSPTVSKIMRRGATHCFASDD